MIDTVTVNQRLLAVPCEDDFLNPKEQEDSHKAKDPEKRHDRAEKQSKEDDIEDKSIDKLNLKSLAFQVVIHFSNCFLLCCNVCDDCLPENTVANINDR